MTLLAKTAVAAAPYGIDKPYDYRVPEELEGKVLPGVRVMVPFGRGNRLSEAVVLLLAEGAAPRGCKTIASVLDESPVLTEDGVALASFLRQRCYCRRDHVSELGRHQHSASGLQGRNGQMGS